MVQEKYLIHELAEEAGITVRTIRYYTDEGLLPQPELQGKYAYYRQEHLERLELIRQMKEAYLPLREIRQVLLNLTEVEVHQRLSEPQPSRRFGEQPVRLDSSPTAGSAVDDAEAYIHRLVKKQSGLLKSSPSRSIQSAAPAAPLKMPAFDSPKVNPEMGEAGDSSLLSSQVMGQVWRRIHLAPGVELNVQEPPTSEQANRLYLLIQYAQKLFQVSR